MSDDDPYAKGDVFWAPDPFRDGGNPRPWLVLAGESLPYRGEEYLCGALTTSDLPDNHRVGEDWIAGGNPDRESYCSPWVIATIKHRAVAGPQGRVTTSFADRMIDDAVRYLDPDSAVEHRTG